MLSRIGTVLWFTAFLVYASATCMGFSGRIRMKVLDSERKPLEGVKVIFEHDDYKTRFVQVTKKDGRVVQQAMPVGNYNTTFSKEGFTVVTGTIFIGMDDNRFMPGFPPECLIGARNWKNKIWTVFMMIPSEGQGESGGGQVDVVEVPTARGGVFDKGLEAYEKNEYETARAEFEKILEEKPELPDTYFLLHNTYAKMNESDKAFEMLRKGVELRPDQARAHRQLALYYEDRGDDDAAIQAYEKSLKLEPDSAFGNRDLGLLMLKKSRFQEAKKLLTRYLKLAPNAEDGQRIRTILTEIEKYVE